jgi:hypothetical protein
MSPGITSTGMGELPYGTKELVKWWFAPMPDKDVYNVYVVKYQLSKPNTGLPYVPESGSLPKPPTPKVVAQWALTSEGVWQPYQDNEQLPAAMRFPGQLLHALSEGQQLNKYDFADFIYDLAQNLLQAMASGNTAQIDVEEDQPK